MLIETKLEVSLVVFRVYCCSRVVLVSTCIRIPKAVEANGSVLATTIL